MKTPMEDLHARTAIDALVTRFFSAFDNRDGNRPRLAELLDCFADHATIVRHADGATELFTVRGFATPRIEWLACGKLVDFHEWETRSTTDLFDGIATRTSRYAKAGQVDGRACDGDGTKCFQFAKLEAGWRITALAWVDDTVA